MAEEESWACPVCQDVRRDDARVIPCNHMFCAGCIQRWARLKDTCPLCRTAMTNIQVYLRGNKYLDCVVSPPTLPVPISFGTTAGPSGPMAAAEHGDVEAERVGGLLPVQWAAVFRERLDLLWPVLLWLEEMLSEHIRLWQINMMLSTTLLLLCQVGLDRAALLQRTCNVLGAFTTPLMDAVIEVTVSRCGPEARRLLGVQEPNNTQRHEDGPEEPNNAQQYEDGPAVPSGPAASPQGTVAPSAAPYGSSAGPEAEELPDTSGGALAGGAAELPAAPSPGERPGDEPGPEAAGPSEQGRSRGPSARGRGGKRSARGLRRPSKRRAASAQRAPPPCKRRPPRRP